MDPVRIGSLHKADHNRQTTTLEYIKAVFPCLSSDFSATIEDVFRDLPPHSEMTEPPFRPREHILEKQRYYQSLHKHTYLKGPYDKITSVAIPLALATASIYMIGRGIYNMSHGIGKKE